MPVYFSTLYLAQYLYSKYQVRHYNTLVMHIIHEYLHTVIYGDIQSTQFPIFTYNLYKYMKLMFANPLIYITLDLSIIMNQKGVNRYKQELYMIKVFLMTLQKLI